MPLTSVLSGNAWAPTMIDLVRQDRGASLRICPVFAAASPAETTRQFHVEFRVTDAAGWTAVGVDEFADGVGTARRLRLRRCLRSLRRLRE